MFEQLKNFDWNSFSQALMTGEAHRHLLVAIIIIICSSLIIASQRHITLVR